ncbi:hypothetical protein Emed_003540 [Eimeria media]
MKTEALDAAIHDALLTYARAKDLEQQHEKEMLGELQTEEEEEEEGEGAKIEDAATTAKRDKMLRVARMLVDSSPRQRNKAKGTDASERMASVARFLESFQELTEDELLHVWSTLYYAAWLSDKPLVQRDFFVRASLLHRRLRCPQAKTLFFCSFFRVLIAEWAKLDRHRTNKFLLFCRIFLAEWMHVLRLLKWEETVVKKATDFLYKEVLLDGNARGVALHLIDILTDEFQELMDSATPSATEGEKNENSVLITDEQKQEERLCAFSWLFVPFLRCCCFSKDTALVSRIHERSLRSLKPHDVDLNFVAETLFALASDKRVREENRKHLFVSHQRISQEAAGGPPSEEAASERRIGSFTPSTFARLMVKRVIPDSPTDQPQRQQLQQQLQQHPQQQLDELLHESPQSRKRQASTAEEPSSPMEEAQASNASGSIRIQSNALQTQMGALSKRAKKRMRMQQQQQQQQLPQQQQQQHVDSSRSQNQALSDAPCGAPMQKAVKHKLKVLTSDKGQVKAKTSDTSATSASSLRLPIDSSAVKGVCYATADSNSSNSSNSSKSVESTSSVSSSRKGESIRDEKISSSSPAPPGGPASSSADTKKEDWGTPSKAGSSVDGLKPQEGATSAESRPASCANSSEEAPPSSSSSSCSSRRRSSRSVETAAVPTSKRVLFNLRKNKVVAFSRFAPSLAVGPASSSPPSKIALNTSTSETPPAPTTAEAPPRGILRAAKLPGPPTPEETACMMPPIVRSAGRQPWWDGATAELMAVLRRALQQSSRARREGGSVKLKKKKRKDKKIKREGKLKKGPVASPPLALST